MCVMSAITPVIQQQWPSIQTLPYQDLSQLQEILRKIDALDKKLGAKTCEEDAPKEAFMQELARRVSELERKLNP